MEPTISIPRSWGYPRFSFGQRTQQGIIIGLHYHPADTSLAHEYGEGWRYSVLPNNHSEEAPYYFDDELQLLSVAELQAQIEAEINAYQQQIALLQQQLAVIGGGLSDG